MVCMHNRLAAHSMLCAGRKRKRGDEELAEMLANICEKADERAAEREERLRLRELEMEERRIERIGMRREYCLCLLPCWSRQVAAVAHFYRVTTTHPHHHIILMIHDYTHHYHIINIMFYTLTVVFYPLTVHDIIISLSP